MKKFIYWLFGETAGRVIVGIWNWLWGLPVESGGKISVKVAEESLRTMQESIQKLAQAVAVQVSAYERAKQKYEAKVKEMQNFEQQARAAQRSGNEEAARLAMSKVIQIEQLLPQLEAQVLQAEQFVNTYKEKLNRERMKLESYKQEMQNMKDIAEINEALSQITTIDSDLSIDSARSQFEQAKNAVLARNLKVKALAELSENPAEKLEADLDKMLLDEEVSRRLLMLQEDSNNQ
ncbi:MAG: PspA/IM30 family protein [Oscillatoriaceae bacterium SKW80]|nr:PspA/IM30 family protein [Oscillatoriaceae bacterium SKYG93]MCX8119785.1 PspA/IM30 family protein [Oscillatoriaceae bacterium SKW80]MDW8452338.1 PspA/IM30 family protein [Oscillatoriaceae cyanobacterium SKYGB_i_bin93]